MVALRFAGDALWANASGHTATQPGSSQSHRLDLTNNIAERALRPYVIWRKTSFFSQSERGDLFRARVMTVAETCRRMDLCAYTLLRTVCEQGIRGETVTIRLPVHQIHEISASHQLEKRPPD
ncbi:MAG: hypothetical protein D4R76_11005 [Methylococcus sp.]|nr:MAG: hypothetical protein D4R76_11005 [Methylococcus sp.]